MPIKVILPPRTNYPSSFFGFRQSHFQVPPFFQRTYRRSVGVGVECYSTVHRQEKDNPANSGVPMRPKAKPRTHEHPLITTTRLDLALNM